MRSARLLAVILALLTVVVWSRAVEAQSSGTTALLIGMRGATDGGGRFEGTFALTRFESRPGVGGIVAAGSLAVVLNGRNIVMPVAIPIRVTPAAVQTAAVAGASSCDALHVDLQQSAFRALGTRITLTGTGFDIGASQPDTSTTSGAGTSAIPGSAGVGATVFSPDTAAAFPTDSDVPAAAGTAFPSTTLGSTVPGVISPVPQQPPVTSSQLGELLCSASRLSETATAPDQVAGVLNQVMSALQQ